MNRALTLTSGPTTMRIFHRFAPAAGAALLAACEETGPSNTPPAATFAARCGTLECTFTNGSTDADGTIERYAWDFGDASEPATARDATHTYAAPGGRYTVTLTVTDDDGAAATAAIEVSPNANGAPSAGFAYLCDGLACTFTDQSRDGDIGGAVVSHVWSFGDGERATVPNPHHTYEADGTYTVVLSVIDNLGMRGEVSRQVTVTRGDGPGGGGNEGLGSFTADCSWHQCTFTDTSGDVIVSRTWTFGDGHTSTAQQPTHAYDVATQTVFRVTLTVTNTDLTTGSSFQDIHVAPPPASAWTPLAPLPGRRTLAGAAALEARVYVVGGISFGAVREDIVAYRPESNEWHRVATLAQPVHSAGVAALDGRIYVAGGLSASAPVAALQIFDPAAGQVTLGPAMPTPLSSTKAAVLGGRLHVIGVAEDPDDRRCRCRSVHLRFDPSTGQWAGRAVPPAYGYTGGAAAIGGRMYLVGGGDDNDLAVYDPASDTWTSVDDPSPRGFSAVVALGGRLYVMGGEFDFDWPTGAVNRFDPATGTWGQVEPLLTPRISPAAAVVGESIYVIGGYSGKATGGSENERLTPE